MKYSAGQSWLYILSLYTLVLVIYKFFVINSNWLGMWYLESSYYMKYVW
jgi:hypothetical protein